MINPGDHATFTVQPKTGLAAGSYNGTIQITDKDGSIKDGVSVSFEVTEPAPVYNLSVSPENLEFGNAEEGYKNIPEAQTVTVTVKKGASSGSVSSRLQEAGLVEDAKTFDNYLCNNGYSRSINPGTYEIVPGTSEEEIAKIITGKH